MAVYFIQEKPNGYVKIGYVRTPEGIYNRLRSLQGGNARELSVRVLVPAAGPAVERRLHAAFDHTRVRGEWFDPTDDLYRLMAALHERPDAYDEICQEFDVPVQRAGRPPSTPRRVGRPSKAAIRARIARQIASGELTVRFENDLK